jgi:NAD(P)-dependent dehydrogenase (short-subunit alcohol dehydrogenase family)
MITTSHGEVSNHPEPVEGIIRPTLQGTFIVTGASSGLGLAIAKAIGAAGGTPIGFDVNKSTEAMEHETVDVSDREAVARAVEAVAEKHANLCGVVANAGIDACGRFLDV